MQTSEIKAWHLVEVNLQKNKVSIGFENILKNITFWLVFAKKGDVIH